MLGKEIHNALLQYRTEVLNNEFPTEEYSPYKMSKEETDKFLALLNVDKTERDQEGEIIHKKLVDQDEYEVTKLY